MQYVSAEVLACPAPVRRCVYDCVTRRAVLYCDLRERTVIVTSDEGAVLRRFTW